MSQTHWKRQFIVLWAGQAVSILTSSISQYALIWYLTDLTGSAAVLSIAMLCGMVPQGVLSLFTGAFADRFDRRRVMMVSDGAIGVVSLWLVSIALTGPLSVAPILVALTLRSVGSAFHTPCIQAVTPLIVPCNMLTKCAGWSQGIQTVSLLISPAVAATLYARVSLPLVIALDAVGACLAILGLLAAQLPALKTAATGGKLHLWQDSMEGLRILRGKRWLWEMSLICALFSIAFMPVAALFPLMSMDFFGLDANAAALVEMLFSAGMLAGSVILGMWGGTKNRVITMIASQAIMGLALMGTGLLRPTQFWLFAGLSAVMGLSAPFFNSTFMALIQSKVEAEYLGRVLGISGAIMTLASPIGLLFTAGLAEKTGLTLWFLIAGAVTLVCGGLCALLPAVRDCDKAPPMVS